MHTRFRYVGWECSDPIDLMSHPPNNNCIGYKKKELTISGLMVFRII